MGRESHLSEPLIPHISIHTTHGTPGTGNSVNLQRRCKYFTLQARTAVDVKFSDTQAKVQGTDFITIKSGMTYNSPEKLMNGNLTLWFASGSASVVVEILQWLENPPA